MRRIFERLRQYSNWALFNSEMRVMNIPAMKGATGLPETVFQSLRLCAKSKRTTAFIAAIAVALAAASARSQDVRGRANSGYHVVHGWPVLPEGRVLGAVAGVGVDSHDNVFVFH